MIDINCLQSAKYDSNHLFANLYIPYCHNLLNRMVSSTVSKALCKVSLIKLALLPHSDLPGHMKLDRAAGSQTEGNIKCCFYLEIC